MKKTPKTTLPPKVRKLSPGERATTWIGSPTSLLAHTVFFVLSFSFVFFGVSLDTILLVLTTAVSLEAIYLAIFIQMAVNRQAASLEGVEDDIEEIQADVREIGEDVEEISEDIDEIGEDIEEISKDIDEISEDVDEISKDIDEIGEGVDEISKDVDEISEDVDEISKDIDEIQEHDRVQEKPSLDKIEIMLKQAILDLERLKNKP